MSLVIAIKDKNRVVLGADKQSSIGDAKDHTCTKIWEVRDLPNAIMGGVGSARASQVIQYSPIIDKNDIGADIDTEFVIKSLAPTIAATLKANGVAVQVPEEGACAVMPNAFIFAFADKAWMIWNDLSVSEIKDYIAIGSGADVAKGALFATRKDNPFKRIVTAIDAAADATLFVDDGIDLLVTDERKDDPRLVATALGYDFNSIKKALDEAIDETITEASPVTKKSKKKAK